MTRYCLVNEINKVIDCRSFDVKPPDPQGKPWRWLERVIEPTSVDPATETVSGHTVQVTATAVVYTPKVISYDHVSG